MKNYDYKWWHHATIYEIYPPKSFAMTLGGGIISKLPYLKSLGVDTLWLCPIFASPPFRDSGYDVSDYYAINPEFGSMSDLESLLEQAHSIGIRIILDMVINHTSDEHPWFKEACESVDSPSRDYYIFRQGDKDQLPNNWESSKTLAPVWTYNDATKDYYLHIYTRHQPDLNWDKKELRQAIYKILRFWLNKGVDGFRLDVINKLAKASGLPDYTGHEDNPYADVMFENNEKVHDFIQEMHSQVFEQFPEAVIIGQTAGITPDQAHDYIHPSRKELNLYLQFEHMDIDKALEGRRRSWHISELYDSVMKWQLLMEDGLWPTVFFGSHDSSRLVARYGDVSEDYHVLSAKMLCTLQLCLGGTQIIYMGDELGLYNVDYEHIDEFTDIRSHDIYRSRRDKGESRESIIEDLRQVARIMPDIRCHGIWLK